MGLSLSIDKNKTNRKFHHHWSNCVGAGRANEGLRAAWQEHLKLAIEKCGFRYIRFHGLFHDDMFVYREHNGIEIYNWHYIDELFDRLLEVGIRPFVEFGFCPKDMASGAQTQFWWKGNVTPPKDYKKWGRLIKNAVSHWIERFGIDEVKKWYFEVWNEPNLHAFWAGTKSEYFELYKVTAKVIKEIDMNLKVGGPATSNFVPDDRFKGEKEDISLHKTFTEDNIDNFEWRGVWIEDFIEYCDKEKLPVDFISTHPYPTDFAFDNENKHRGYSRDVNATKKDLEWLKRVVKNSSFSNAEIHLTEWNSSPSSRDLSHDYLPAATYIAKVNIDTIGLADSLSYWTFTDVFEEVGAGESLFHGGFGLINIWGIVKPTFHAYRFLNSLGDELIEKGEGYIITKQNGKLRILIYNYPKEMKKTIPMSPYPNREIAEDIEKIGESKNIDIEVNGLEDRTNFTIEILDCEHGHAVNEWKKFGCIEYPKKEQIELLKERALMTKKIDFELNPNKNKLNIQLKPWAIAFISEK